MAKPCTRKLCSYKLQYTEDLQEYVQFSFPIYEAACKAVPATKFYQRIINKLTMNGLRLPVKRQFNIVPTEVEALPPFFIFPS